MSEKTVNTFAWEKMGRVFRPDGRYSWMQHYAQNPSVLTLDDRLRVYFTCRGLPDADGMFASVTTFVDLSRTDPREVIYVHDRPILPLGDPGTFDQFGVMPGTVLQAGGEVRLYYVGWTRTLGVPYNHAIGLARSRDHGMTFERAGRGPVITRSVQEPFIQNSPFAMEHDGIFHMWYSSGIDWVLQDGKPESIYVLMHATSVDGVQWNREGIPFLTPVVEAECQTNPCVFRKGDRFHMWFCYRHGLDFRNAQRGYKIGYAWSHDLKHWTRDDRVGALEPSTDGWDSQMVCYPCVVSVDDNTYMFYSGNYFGREGFGCARLVSGG